ncbi:hypothetical protein A2U01_0077736, partial [Trifolium medium]|nr:hypothetical protein [Trifolium medium]
VSSLFRAGVDLGQLLAQSRTETKDVLLNNNLQAGLVSGKMQA